VALGLAVIDLLRFALTSGFFNLIFCWNADFVNLDTCKVLSFGEILFI